MNQPPGTGHQASDTSHRIPLDSAENLNNAWLMCWIKFGPVDLLAFTELLAEAFAKNKSLIIPGYQLTDRVLSRLLQGNA